MNTYPPEPPNMSGDKPPTIHNPRHSHLCEEKWRKYDWISVSSENGEQWVNWRTSVKKNMTGFCRIQSKEEYSGLCCYKF